MLVLGVARDSKWAFVIIGGNSNSVTADCLRELPCGDQDRPFQVTPVAQLFSPLNVFANGKGEPQSKCQHLAIKRCGEHSGHRCVSENPVAQSLVKSTV